MFPWETHLGCLCNVLQGPMLLGTCLYLATHLPLEFFNAFELLRRNQARHHLFSWTQRRPSLPYRCGAHMAITDKTQNVTLHFNWHLVCLMSVQLLLEHDVALAFGCQNHAWFCQPDPYSEVVHIKGWKHVGIDSYWTERVRTL